MNLSQLENYRVTTGFLKTNKGDRFGLFFIPTKNGFYLKTICSPFDGTEEWEHVSVSLPNRCPTWDEMCKVKDLFWGEDLTVVQYHPEKSQYINNHPHCLHLFRNTKTPIELPPSILVGLKHLNIKQECER